MKHREVESVNSMICSVTLFVPFITSYNTIVTCFLPCLLHHEVLHMQKLRKIFSMVFNYFRQRWVSHNLKHALSKWNFADDRIVAATTDNVANITAGLNMLCVLQLLCFSYALQFVMEQALKLLDITKITC